MTVVFCDVEGSTQLLGRVGDDEGYSAVARQLAIVSEQVADYGGTTVKSTGDGLLLTFRSPRQAVSFTLSSQRALSTSLPRVRFGVNAGEVLNVGKDPHGMTVNAAARIASRAAGGEVLVSDIVRQLVGNLPAVTFSDRGRCRLKGFSELWHLWSVEENVRAHPTGPTIGRGGQLATIEELLSALAEGRGTTALVEGEAGIGKTHLARHAAARARHLGVGVVEVEIDEVVRVPGAVPRGLLRAATVRNRSRSRLDGLLSEQLEQLGADLSFAVVEASVDVVEEMSGRAPVLLVVEDVHWADELSLAVLVALARRVNVSYYSLLGTLRPAPRSTALDRLLELARDSGGLHMRLGALDDADVSALASLLTGAATGEGLRSRLPAAGGNPLYITELIRSLDEDGLLRVASGIADADAGVAPGTLHGTLVRRLSWLPPETGQLLRLASLLGSAFTLHDLAAVTGLPVVDVAAQLREATLAGLVVGSGDRLTFRHDLIREAVYEHMSPAERRDLHRAAGHALGRTGAPTPLVAEQFARGALPGDLEAVGWLERAAREVVAIAPNDAVSLLERADALAPPGWPGRLAIQAQMIEPLALADRYDDAERLASTILDAAPEPDVEHMVLRALPLVHGFRGHTDEEIAAFFAAAAASGTPPDEARRLWCVATQVSALHGATPAIEARTAAEHILSVAIEEGDLTTQCVAHQTLGVMAFVTGESEAARRHLDISMALFESRSMTDAVFYLTPDRWHALCLLELDEVDEARVAAAAARHRAEQLGTKARLASPYMVGAMVDYATGRWDDAAAALETGAAIIDETRNVNFVLYIEALTALIALHRGDLTLARKHVAAGIEHFRGGRAYFGADWLFGVHAEVLAAYGKADAAFEVASLTWERTTHVRYTFGHRHRGISLVKLAVRAGQLDRANSVAADLEEGARRSPAHSAAGAALLTRALVDGDPDCALGAVAQYRLSPLRAAHAAACEDAAGVMRAAGRSPEGITLLQEAATIHTETDNATALARVDAALRELGARRAARREKRPASGWGSLTPMERSVSELVFDGLTNPEIGARLYISRRTVETHLSHVYSKLGLAGRTQLVAEYARRAKALADGGG